MVQRSDHSRRQPIRAPDHVKVARCSGRCDRRRGRRRGGRPRARAAGASPRSSLEAEAELAPAASGSNSGILHTGFDSDPGELETELILRSNDLRERVLERLGVPVIRCGGLVRPNNREEARTVDRLAANAKANGVEAAIAEDGALEVPGEAVTDPVAYTAALAATAAAAGARIRRGARVDGDRTRGGEAHAADRGRRRGHLHGGGQLRRPARRRGRPPGRRPELLDLPAQGRVLRLRPSRAGFARADPAPGAERAHQGGARVPDGRRQAGRRADRSRPGGQGRLVGARRSVRRGDAEGPCDAAGARGRRADRELRRPAPGGPRLQLRDRRRRPPARG